MSIYTKPPEYKAHAPDSIELDYQGRTISGYFATFDLDRVGDTIDKKAFVKTFRERGPRPDGSSKIKVDFNHSCIVGVPVELGYDSKGAFYRGRIDKTQQGDEVLERIRNKSLDVNSFVYDVMDYVPVHNGEFAVIDGGYEVQHRRHLTELRLHAVGPVDAACNEAAVITAVKAIGRTHGSELSEADQRALLASLKSLNAEIRQSRKVFDPYGLRALTRAIRSA